MVRKLILLCLWFPLTFIFLIINLSVLSLSSSKQTYQDELITSSYLRDSFQLAAPSGTARVLGAQVIAGDARIPLLKTFLLSHNSPLAPYANVLVEESDKNGIDFRLTTAVAMCESNAGKRIPSKDSYNAWGIAVYTGQQNGAKFKNWSEAIRWVSNYIKTKYYDRGIVDLKDVGSIWAPPSVEKGYSWTNCVESFMSMIQ